MIDYAACAGLLDDSATARVLGILDRDGEEARIIGGAVRDALLGRPVEDIDIATTALPNIVLNRARAREIRAVPTGIEHGTVTLLQDGRRFEVTTLRADVETHGRRATVRFGRDWLADAKRRDFTINALSLDGACRLHDPIGGLADLEAGRVRFIGDARIRIQEDFLRILRFFRFHARYGDGAPDAEALAAAIEERAGLALLSAERVQDELLKILGTARAAEAVTLMTDTGIMQAVLGGVPRTARFSKLVALQKQFARPADPVLRLAALALFVPEDATRLRERLRLGNKALARLTAAAPDEGVLPDGAGAPALRNLLYRVGAETYADRVLLAAADGLIAQDELAAALALPDRWPVPKLPVTAADLIELGIPSGPALGRALKGIEAAWVAADFPLEPEVVRGLVERAARQDDAQSSLRGA